jgi:hypothetical protein
MYILIEFNHLNLQDMREDNLLEPDRVEIFKMNPIVLIICIQEELSRNQQRTNSNVTTQPNRVESPSRVQQRTNTPVTPQPSRVETPSRVQQRTNTPVTTQPTRSRVQNREN